jgi:hypothetical protein
VNASPTLTKTTPQLLLEFAGSFPAPMPEQLQHENTTLLAQYLNSWTRAFGEPSHREDGDFRGARSCQSGLCLARGIR